MNKSHKTSRNIGILIAFLLSERVPDLAVKHQISVTRVGQIVLNTHRLVMQANNLSYDDLNMETLSTNEVYKHRDILRPLALAYQENIKKEAA